METTLQRSTKLRAEVQQLAHKVHLAKRDLDWHQYNWAGLDDPQVRANSTVNEKMFPDNFVSRTIEEKAAAYRKARKEWLVKKTQLAEIEEGEQITRSITSARQRMERRFKPTVQTAARAALIFGDDGFSIADHPKLQAEITATVREAVGQMQAERSVASVLAVVETLAAADELGYGDVCAGQRNQSMDAALQMARRLRDEAARSVNPKIPDQLKRLLRHEVLVQYLGE
jgi:hypothetical protein